MKNVKFEIIREFDGTVAGYKLGNHYLMKHYYWDNSYSWIINTTGNQYYTSYDFHKAYDNKEIEIVLNCKEGKQRLIALNMEG